MERRAHQRTEREREDSDPGADVAGLEERCADDTANVAEWIVKRYSN
jgi:hypothetical protein